MTAACSVVALVPARSLPGGKTRLAGALPPEAREALTRRMFRHVIRTAVETGAVDTVLVISPDPDALALGESIDPIVVTLTQDAEHPGLNGAVAQGLAWAQQRQANAFLVLFGDLPRLTPTDCLAIIRGAAPVVIASDRHGTGTNALLLRLASIEDSFAFRFGTGSLENHIAEAERLGLSVAMVETAGTAFDLDTPEDLAILLAENGALSEVVRDVIAPALPVSPPAVATSIGAAHS